MRISDGSELVYIVNLMNTKLSIQLIHLHVDVVHLFSNPSNMVNYANVISSLILVRFWTPQRFHS